jgi:hypothetical protein
MSKKKFRRKGLMIRGILGPPDISIEYVRPESNEEVYYPVELAIGTDNEDGDARFTLVIATPEALRQRAAEGPAILVDRAFLIVSEYDWDAIRTHLEDVLKKCEALTLHESIPLLQRYFRWEYEEYKR